MKERVGRANPRNNLDNWRITVFHLPEESNKIKASKFSKLGRRRVKLKK